MYKDSIEDYEIHVEKGADCNKYRIVVYREQSRIMETFCIYESEEAALKNIENVKDTLYRKVINRDGSLKEIKNMLKENNFEVEDSDENFYIVRKCDIEHKINENDMLSKDYIKKLTEVWNSVTEYVNNTVQGKYAEEIFYSDIGEMTKDFDPPYRNIVFGILSDTLKNKGYRVYC